MQLFLDTANIDQIRQAAKLGVISGVTTNPTLVSWCPMSRPPTMKR